MGIISMPPPGGVDCSSTQPSRGTTSARQRGNVGTNEGEIPRQRSNLCLRGSSGSGGSKCLFFGGSGPKWRPEEEFDPRVALEVINSRNALSVAGSDGLRYSHFQSIIRTDFGPEKFDAWIEAFWRRNHRRSKRLPTGVLAAFATIQPHCLGRKMPACLRRIDVETSRCGRDHAAVATAAGDQPRGETAWGRSRRGGWSK